MSARSRRWTAPTTARGCGSRPRSRGEIAPGDSVAVNGVCLTATEVGGGSFAAEAMNETLSVTSLGPLGPGSRVNLELALRASDRLGGHIVQGHVDGTAEVVEVVAGRVRAAGPGAARARSCWRWRSRRARSRSTA